MMKAKNDDVRGVSNSPLTDTIDGFIQSGFRGKEVKFDWFQVTFDFIPVDYVQGKNVYALERNHSLFLELLSILKRKEHPNDFESMHQGMWGFRHGLNIDEHIWFLYGGKKTNFETYPCQFIISGQGCRVFEQMGGSWLELFKYFQRNGTQHLKIGNLHLAIDDFEGTEVTPYTLRPYFENKWLVTPFRIADLVHRLDYTGQPSNLGYSWTFGKRGSNQLQIYDKALERESNNFLNTYHIWYRYEMRFVEDKARQVLDMYVQAIENEGSLEFMKFAKKLLLSIMDVKKPSKTDTNKSRWKTLDAWSRFTNSFEKIDLTTKNRIETTIEKKKVWFNSDMATTLMEFLIVFGVNFLSDMLGIAANSKFDRKHLNRINNYLRSIGKDEMTLDDVRELQKQYKLSQDDSEAVVNKETAKIKK